MRGIPRILRGIRKGEKGFSLGEMVVATALFASAVLGAGSLLISGGSLIGSSSKANAAMRLASGKIEDVKSLPFYVPWQNMNADIDDTYWRWSNPNGTGTPLTNAQQVNPVPGEAGYEEYGTITGFPGYKRTTTVQYVCVTGTAPTTQLKPAIMMNSTVTTNFPDNWVPKNPDPDVTKHQDDNPKGVRPSASEPEKPDMAATPEFLHMLTIEVKVSYKDNGVEKTYTERGLASDLLSSGETQNNVMVVKSIQAVNPNRQPAWGYKGYPGEDIVCDVSIDAPEMTATDAVQISLWRPSVSDIPGYDVQHVPGQPDSDRRVTFHVDNCGSYPEGWYSLAVYWTSKQFKDSNLRDCFEFRDRAPKIDTVESLTDPKTIAEYNITTANSGANGITSGPDGNLWFTEQTANKIGCITTAGVVTEYNVPTSGSAPYGITLGYDGNLWFTESSASVHKIGRITTSGVITEFGPTAGTPWRITAGPDGNLWFTEWTSDRVGRITTDGTITEYPTAAGSWPSGITSGPDGNLWFSELLTNKIARITTTGAITEYAVPTGSALPSGIVAGSDGNLWFTEYLGNKIGKITTAGVITEYAVPTSGSVPVRITATPDGNLWFTENAVSANKIGRITTNGTFTEFAVPTASSGPYDITVGPDEALWFTESAAVANKIGRITTGGLETPAWGFQTQNARKLFITGTGLGVTGEPLPTVTLEGKVGATDYKFTGSDAVMGADGETLTETFNLGASAPSIPAGGWPSSMNWDLKIDRGGGSTGVKTACFVMNPQPVVTGVADSGTQQPGNIHYYDKAWNSQTSVNVKLTGTYLYDLEDYVNTPLGDGVELADKQNNPTHWCPSKLNGVRAAVYTGSDINNWLSTDNWVIVEFDPSGGVLFGPSTKACVVVRNPGGMSATDPNDDSQNVLMNPSTGGTITEYNVTTSSSLPYDITSGPDGNLWFAEYLGNKIAKITTAGTITEYTVPTSGGNPTGITAGPDGNLWFTEYGANKIGKITTAGVFTEYAVTTASSSPYSITAGPDGNLWFTEYAANKIGKITTAGVITEYAVTTSLSAPHFITTGPDGNLWFTEYNVSKVAKITTAGVITEYAVPTSNSRPTGITPGPDGNLWFDEYNVSKVAKVTTAGVFTEYAIPTSGSGPYRITSGVDGCLWFTELNVAGNKIGRITTAGTLSEFALPNSNSMPLGITSGPDLNIWFTEYAGNRIGHITPGSAFVEEFGTTGNNPDTITAGPDGNLWFTEYATTANKIGKITTAGVITEYAVPTANSGPYGITAGPDGNLWFTEILANKIGRITTAGVITEFGPTGAWPTCITAGSDGNLWFTEFFGNKIGRITTAGVITEFTVPTASCYPFGITEGPGGLWFTEYATTANKIGFMTTGGAFTEYNVPTSASGPWGIAAGPDDNVWFTENAAGGNKIGCITASGVFTEYAVPTSSSGPLGITAGPDDNLWFAENLTSKIGRVTTDGTITEFQLATGRGPYYLTAGPDGNVWFTEYSANKIGRIRTTP